MGRKRKSEDDLKVTFTLRVKKSIKEKVRQIPNYNPKLEQKMLELIDEEGIEKMD